MDGNSQCFSGEKHLLLCVPSFAALVSQAKTWRRVLPEPQQPIGRSVNTMVEASSMMGLFAEVRSCTTDGKTNQKARSELVQQGKFALCRVHFPVWDRVNNTEELCLEVNQQAFSSSNNSHRRSSRHENLPARISNLDIPVPFDPIAPLRRRIIRRACSRLHIVHCRQAEIQSSRCCTRKDRISHPNKC